MTRLARLAAVFEARTRTQLELIVFLVLGLLHLFYVFTVSTPLIHADEAGHLLKAAALAGYTTHGPTPYGIGFPVLISPLFWVLDDPEIIFRSVLIANAALATATAWLAYRFLLAWDDSHQNWRAALLAAVGAALYPAGFAYTTSAQAEVLFSLVVAGLLLANLQLAKSDGQGWWPVVFSALLTGFIVPVHLRGAPTFLLSGLFVSFILLRARRFDALAVWAVIAVGIVGIGRWMARSVQDQLTLESLSDISAFSSSTYKLMSKLEAFASLDGFVTGLGRLFLIGTGQFSYLVATTFGLFVIGILAVAKRTGFGFPAPVRAFAVFGLLLLATNIAMSTVALFPGGRVDHIIYGRYNEALLPVFLAIGLFQINRSGIRIALSAFVTALVALVLILTNLPEGAFLPANLHNLTGLYWFWIIFERFGGVLTIAAGCIATALFLFVRRRLPIVPLVCVVFVLQSVLLTADLLKPSSDGRAFQRRIAEYIRTTVEPGTCITQHLTGDTSAWAHWNTKFFLFNYPIREESRIQPGQICSHWVISADPELWKSHPGAILIHKEHKHPERLWYVGQNTETLRYPNELAPGDHITFSGYPAGVDFLGSGWGITEHWGIWMVGPLGTFDFRIPKAAKGECRLRLRGEWFLNERRPEGRVFVKLGRGTARTFEGHLPDERFDWLLTFHSDDAIERRIAVDIRAENPQSMQELGLRNDTRKLSIGLVELDFLGCEN